MNKFLLVVFLQISYKVVFSCQPPIPSASVISQPSQQFATLSPPLAYGQQSSNEQVNVDRSREWEPYPGYVPPLSANGVETLIPLTSRALSSNRIPNGNVPIIPPAPLSNFPPPNGIELADPSPIHLQNENSMCSKINNMDDWNRCIQDTVLPKESSDAWKCNFEEDSSCRFIPISTGFSVGRLPSPSAYSSFATLSNRQTYDSPKGNFLYIKTDRGMHPNAEFIISTVVKCQKGKGVLKFDYWLFPSVNVEMKVCTMDEKSRSCTMGFSYEDKSTVVVEVVHPESESFEVQIVATKILVPTLLVIDDIDYRAELCEGDETPSQPLLPMNSGKDEKEEAEFFQPEDISEDSTVPLPSEEELNTVTEDIRRAVPHYIPERPINRMREREIYTENTVLDGPSPPSEMFLENDSETLDYDSFNQRDEIKEDVHSHPPPMSKTIIKHRQLTPIRPQIAYGKTNRNECDVLPCDFEENLCGWTNYGDNNNKYGIWSLGNKKFGASENVDQPVPSGFAYVAADNEGISTKQKGFILESGDILTAENVTLLFDVYRISDDITLQVCFDSRNFCPFKLPPYGSENDWLNDIRVRVPVGTRKIFFKAIQWKKFKWLAIDNIRVSEC